MEKTGVLKGLRVLDFGQYIAGPLTAMILGDYGADVIHVDPPGGPRWDGWNSGAVLGRGKRNIILDLKDASDLETAKKLAASADILIENFRPGVMDRLGFSYEELRKINPGIIYASVSGFGQYGSLPSDGPRVTGVAVLPENGPKLNGIHLVIHVRVLIQVLHIWNNLSYNLFH